MVDNSNAGITERHTASVKHIQQDDIDFIRFLKTDRASVTIGELHKHISEHCDICGGTSNSAIKRELQNMTNRKWTWKKLTRPVAEKFTPDNLNYCQDYVNYISTVDPYKLKFFDESGIKLPDVGRPNYGHSLCGTLAVEIMPYANSPNVTLNLMCGLDGIVYANTVDGNSNLFSFLSFFEEASSVYLPDGKPAYSYGDHVIIENAPIHHDRAGKALGEWLDEIGCTAVYLQTYSPEFNPAENVFNRLETILRRFKYRQL